MAYRIAAIPMILSGLHVYSHTACILNAFSYSCAAADMISNGVVRRAVPLRWLSFLSNVSCWYQDCIISFTLCQYCAL